VRELHRYSSEIGASLKQILVWDRNTRGIIGVGILDRPVSQVLDDGLTLEVSQTATDVTAHAYSAVLGALAREVWLIKLRGRAVYRLTTYTRVSETNASLPLSGCARRQTVQTSTRPMITLMNGEMITR
jgi:hypothetical protein